MVNSLEGEIFIQRMRQITYKDTSKDIFKYVTPRENVLKGKTEVNDDFNDR